MIKIDFTELYKEVKREIANNTMEAYIRKNATILPNEGNRVKDIQDKIDLLNEIFDCVLVMQNTSTKGMCDSYLMTIENEIKRLHNLTKGMY